MGVRVVFPDMGKDPSVQLIEKTITENGTYDAITDGANGYSKVNVNVEGGGGSSDFSLAKMGIIVEGAGASNVVAVQVNNITTSIKSDAGGNNYYKAEKGFTMIMNNPDPYLNILVGETYTNFDIPDVIAVNMQQQPLTISNITFSGNAETQSDDSASWVEITGDCTMTITIS